MRIPTLLKTNRNEIKNNIYLASNNKNIMRNKSFCAFIIYFNVLLNHNHHSLLHFIHFKCLTIHVIQMYE